MRLLSRPIFAYNKLPANVDDLLRGNRIKDFRFGDFTYRNLTDTSALIALNKMNLRGADFQGSDLYGRQMKYSNLKGANLSRTRLTKGSLTGSNLENANLNHTECDRTKFIGRNLKGATVEGMKIYQTIFSEADVEGVDFSEINRSWSYQTSKGTMSPLRYSPDELLASGTSVKDRSMFGAIFTKANLRFSNFSSIKLYNSTFQKTNMESSNLSGIDANGCWFDEVNFRYADLRGAKFEECRLNGADFTGADLRGAVFLESELIEAVFDGAKMDGVIFTVESYLNEADFRNTNIENVEFAEDTNLYVGDAWNRNKLPTTYPIEWYPQLTRRQQDMIMKQRFSKTTLLNWWFRMQRQKRIQKKEKRMIEKYNKLATKQEMRERKRRERQFGK